MALTRITVLDSHTGGEPTRLVLDGFPSLGDGGMAERKAILAERYDAWRRVTMLEPRGSDVLVGALLCTPANPSHTAGIIFFDNAGYLGMCGHGTIGVIASLAFLGRIAAGRHIIETPVGNVTATLLEDGSVSVENVPSYRLHHAVEVELPGHGRVSGDVAWGGNWFFLTSDHGQRVAADNIEALTEFAWALRLALEAQGIHGRHGALIDHIELFADDARADSRSFVLCPGKAYDRSACGTGTSAKLACLAADGMLEPGRIWRQASIIGSEFEGSYARAGEGDAIIPTIRGRAHISAHATLILQEDDPFKWGIQLDAAAGIPPHGVKF
jgi:4-hydroxyproline epimerase